MTNSKRTVIVRFGVALSGAALVALMVAGCSPKPIEEASPTPPAGANGAAPAGSPVTSGPGAPVIQPGMAGVPKK